jgi:hypothetical protein
MLKPLIMNAIVVIFLGLPKFGLIAGLVPAGGQMAIVLVNLFTLFNGQFLFILKFFGEVLLIFILGGLIGKLLHLDRENKSDSHSQSG